jgi:hypothetical protein
MSQGSKRFYVHRFAPRSDGTLSMLEPQCVACVDGPGKAAAA